jgi:hypothetical protein
VNGANLKDVASNKRVAFALGSLKRARFAESVLPSAWKAAGVGQPFRALPFVDRISGWQSKITIGNGQLEISNGM